MFLIFLKKIFILQVYIYNSVLPVLYIFFFFFHMTTPLKGNIIFNFYFDITQFCSTDVMYITPN